MIELRVEPGVEAARALMAIKAVAWDNPGVERLKLVMETRSGRREVLLGPEWGYAGDERCMAELAEFGEPSFAGPWPLLRAELLALHIFEECVLFGSAPMLLAGLRDSIGDIDLFVTPGAWSRLIERGWTSRRGDEAHHPPYLERFGLGEGLTVHAFWAWRADEPEIDPWEALCERETVRGWPCIPLELLVKHKRAAGVYRGTGGVFEKHVRDVQAIVHHLRLQGSPAGD